MIELLLENMNWCDIIFIGCGKMRKNLWIVLLIVGIIPFIAPLVYGIYNSINGFSGMCWWACEHYDYGFKALTGSIILYSYIFWPTYIIGIALVILSVIKLKSK